MNEKTVTIPESEYKELLDAADQLRYLEAGGVDNWTWYSESLQPYWEKKEAEEEDNDIE